MATQTIEKIIDPSAPPEERAQRRRRLTQGGARIPREPRRSAEGKGEMTGPRPACRPWTRPEDNQLRALSASGMKHALIAQKLKRTLGAVQSRINTLKKTRKPPSPDRTELLKNPGGFRAPIDRLARNTDLLVERPARRTSWRSEAEMQSYGGSIEINSVDRVAPLRAIVIAMLFIIGIVAVATLRTTTIRNGARSLSEFRLSAVLTPSVLDQIEARTPSPHGRLSRARMQGRGKLTVEGMRGLSGQIEKQAPSPAIEASDLDSAIPRASEFDMTAESEPLNIAHFATPTSPLNVGPVPYMQWVRVDKRVIDRSYQRSISRAGS